MINKVRTNINVLIYIKSSVKRTASYLKLYIYPTIVCTVYYRLLKVALEILQPEDTILNFLFVNNNTLLMVKQIARDLDRTNKERNIQIERDRERERERERERGKEREREIDGCTKRQMDE